MSKSIPFRESVKLTAILVHSGYENYKQNYYVGDRTGAKNEKA